MESEVFVILSKCFELTAPRVAFVIFFFKLRLVVTSTKKTIEPSNYTHPYKITVNMEEIPLNPSRIQQRKFLVERTIITDLRNDMFGGEEQKGSFFDDEDVLAG